MTKKLVTVEKTDRIAMDQFALIQTSEDCAEGVQSFIEKRDPVFTGR